MNIFFSLFIIGFTAAALPGAVQTTVFLSTLQGKAKAGIKVALGAAVMDGLYLFLAYYGIVEFITRFTVIKIVVGLFGFGYMLWLGVSGLKQSLKKTDTKTTKPIHRGFFNGMLLVLLHIPTLFYFIGVAGSVFHEQISLSTVGLGVISLFTGAILCFLLVVAIGWLSKRYGKAGLIQVLQTVSAGVLIIFAVKLFFQLITMF